MQVPGAGPHVKSGVERRLDSFPGRMSKKATEPGSVCLLSQVSLRCVYDYLDNVSCVLTVVLRALSFSYSDLVVSTCQVRKTF